MYINIGIKSEIMKYNADQGFAQSIPKSSLNTFSVLLPLKHLNKCLGLLRSRSDPIRNSKIQKDKTSTLALRLFNINITPPLSLSKARLQTAKSYIASLSAIKREVRGF